jgi:predicted enzyme related to lactoylglutathione lyase
VSAPKGYFVWHDLMTTDVEGAKAFYSEVIGWRLTPWAQGDYAMWTAGEQPIGGVIAQPEQSRQAGVPPHWMGYAQTEDVDATVKRAEQLGGRTYVPPRDIPTVGRFAVLADPQGAVFAVFTPLTPMAEPAEKPGHHGWAELNTTDYLGAWRFYSELLGWKPTQAMEMGPEFGTYFMFGVDSEKSMGGMSNAAKMMNAPPHWLYYVTVADLDATLERVKQRGGRILNGPMEVPGGDRIAQCMDPQGAAFAVYAKGPR